MQEFKIDLSQFSDYQISAIMRGFDFDLTDEQMKFVINPGFDYMTMRLIVNRLVDGLTTIEQVKTFAKPKLSSKKLLKIKKWFNRDLTDESLSIWGKTDITIEQMKGIFDKKLWVEKGDKRWY